MRTLHRWIMTVTVILLLYLALSGLLLQGLDLIVLGQPGPKHAADLKSIREFAFGPPYFSVLTGVDETAPTLAEADLPAALNVAFAATRRLIPDGPLTSMEVRRAGDILQVVVIAGASDATARELTFDARSGELMEDRPAARPADPQSTHDAIKDWHRGNIVGITGVWLNFGTGTALLLLCISGIWIYFQMQRRRRRTGRHGWFWH